MSEFFRNRFDAIFQIDDSGNILKFSSDSGLWNVVTDFSEADLDCKPCSAIHLNNIQLAVYFRKSENKELANGGHCFGKLFTFYNNLGQIYSIDENKNEYICAREFMCPVEQGTVNKDWDKVPSDSVFNKIQSLDSFFIKELELYVFEMEDIKLFQNSFLKNIPVEVQERLQALYFYLKKSHEHCSASGIDFIFYKDNFGCVYAKDEKRNEYVCNEDFLTPIKKKTIKNSWKTVDKYFVLEYVKKYSQYKKNLPTKKIDLSDLDLYISRNNDFAGITEDGREFRLSKVTGELEPVKKIHGLNFLWKNCSKIEAIKYQFKKREEYRGISALNDYLKKCNDIQIEKGEKEIGKNLTFYKNDFGRVFAKDDKFNEYVCEEGCMIPLVNKGGADYLWEPIESCQVTYMIKAYGDMVRGICEKNKNLKEMQKYIKENEKRQLERNGIAFGYNFRFFVNSVGHIFAKDEANREYYCNPNEMAITTPGTIDEEWDSILESDVIKYLR